ncbi:MAG: UDP-glucose/GDP-mannose dehydrogenase family protein [Chloroflexi bacterium]|nr:UDP-glucose/GDP-mannose dehydrogenase family protein [Chloroflexota bacterium]
MLVGIVGYGTVGRATAALFRDVVIHDPPQGYEAARALSECAVVFLCVPTPASAGGSCDLTAVHEAAHQVVPLLSEKQVVAVRSTVPPGTVRQLQEMWPETHFASNPEFLRAHCWREDALRPARVIIGADTVYARQMLLKAYHQRLAGRVPYVVTDSLTAEFIKYAANCFLATKIAYACEVRQAAQRIGARYGDVVRAVALDPRIAGGDEWWLEGLVDECLPKDLAAFVEFLRQRQADSPLLKAVLKTKDGTMEARDLVRQGAGHPGR